VPYGERDTLEPLSVALGTEPTVPTILLLAPSFPPATTPGAARVASFVDEFRRRTWRTVVLTAGEGNGRGDDVIELRHVEAGPVQRVLAPLRMSRVATTLRIPDAHAVWLVRAVRAAQRLHRTEHFDLVISSALPASASLAGAVIAARLGIPHVADFRDPWSFNPYYVWPTRAHQRIDALLEGRVVSSAAAVLAPSPEMVDALVSRHPSARAKAHVVLNGVEEHLIREVDDGPAGGDEFVITTVRSPYVQRRQRWPYYFHGDVDSFVSTPQVLIRSLEQTGLSVPVRVRVVGSDARDVDVAGAREAGIAVDFEPRVDRQRALYVMVDTDLIFHPVASNVHVHPRGIAIATRLYEYLATGRELVIAAGDGASRDLGSRFPGVYVINPGDSDALSSVLRERVDAWRAHGRGFYPRPDVPTREAAAVQVADLLAGLTNG